MYTIKATSNRTGVSIPLLRAWERRYGIVAPIRTASGYRLYDDVAIGRLRTMRRLIADGWTPSSAAGAIVAGRISVTEPEEGGEGTVSTNDGGTARVGGAVASERGDAPSLARRGRRLRDGDPDGLGPRFLDAAAALDQAGLEQALDGMLASGSFESVADGLLLPTLVELGKRWQAGRIDVAGEHAASHAVLRRLAAAFQAAGRPPGRDRPILVGLPPGSRHELGALTVAVAARRAGIPVLYLGPDLPVADWVVAADRTRARAAVVGAPTTADIAAAVDVGRALLAAPRPAALVFGGRAAGDAVAALASVASGAIALDADLGEAVATLATIASGRSRTPADSSR